MTPKTYPSAAVAVRDAATIVLLRDGAPDAPKTGELEILLLRRHAGHVFGANADVFPGGALDADDEAATRLTSVRATGQADDAWRMAAVRECFEEAGILLVDNQARLDSARVASLRSALNNQRLGWAEVLEAIDQPIALDRLVAFAQWTTPEGAPKRYATRFFAARAPDNQIATADGDETIAAEWIRPAEALAEAEAGYRKLMRPTRATLIALSNERDSATAIDRWAAHAKCLESPSDSR